MTPMNALVDELAVELSVLLARLLILVGVGVLARLLYLEYRRRRRGGS